MEIKFKNHYSQIGKKEDFKIKYNAEDKTDQSQITSASITEMAKRYGIDAIIAKAEQLTIENTNLQDKLYGNDYTQMFKSKEALLNTKKNLNNLFENIPARIRKEYFNDNPMEFINAYTTNDERKLEQLKNLGIVSQSQFEQVKQYNTEQANIRIEQQKQNAFMQALKEQQGDLYENFKQTGTISINYNKDNTTNTPNVQTGV